jgi:hypothetical protein
MRRACFVALIAIATAGAAGAAPPMLSWGKPGVTLEQYRTDAVDCGVKGAFHDVSGAEPTKAFIAAQEWNDRNLNMAMQGAGMDPVEQQSRMVQRFRPGKRIEEVQAILVTQTERCLFDRGYQPFRLTKAQDKALRRLKLGSPARHAYLHALAADPAILQAQATVPGKS